MGADGSPRSLPLVLEVTDRPSWGTIPIPARLHAAAGFCLATTTSGLFQCILVPPLPRGSAPKAAVVVSASREATNKPSGISSWCWGPFLPLGKPHSPSLFLPLPRDRAARLVADRQGHGLLRLHPRVGVVSQPQGHQHTHCHLTHSPVPFSSCFWHPAVARGWGHITLSTSLWASRFLPCTASCPQS